MTTYRDQIEALRSWLQSELGDGANVYHQANVDPCPPATSAQRFSISVPVSEMTSLLLLRKMTGPVRVNAVALIVVHINPIGEIKSQGRHARRDFAIHIRAWI